MKREIIIKFDIEGFHKYEKAPEQVAFLRDLHRHTFKVKCGIKVNHNERDKELFMVRGEIIDYINESYGIPADFGNMSVESIAQDILEFGKEDGMIWVEVWEEDTGGGRISL